MPRGGTKIDFNMEATGGHAEHTPIEFVAEKTAPTND
jgi:hypothetical protein